jgi:phosphatidylserine decarboxylase
VANNWADRYLSIPIDRCVWPALALSAGVLAVAIVHRWRITAVAAAVFMALLAFFFRDPERPPIADARAFVSPADGVVMGVRLNGDPEAGPLGGPCITIFLAVWNVHVNRVPHHGVVEKVLYVPGGHAPAFRDTAAGNESNWIWFRAGDQRFAVRQVAGKVARRVVCRLRVGDWVRQGQRLGIIKLGSRTDLYLPVDSRVLVRSGDRVVGGNSVLAIAPDARNGSHV